MKRIVAGLAIAVFAGAIAWWAWPRAGTRPAIPPAPAANQHANDATQNSRIDISRVRKLSPDERRRLGEEIRTAIARARTASTTANRTAVGSAPALPDEPDIPLEQVSTELFAALKESLPLVAECYRQPGAANEAMAMMTLISDPELGTVIDTEAITERDGKAVDPKLDECMRDTIDSLGLPPLGKPGRLKVQYTFRLTD